MCKKSNLTVNNGQDVKENNNQLRISEPRQQQSPKQKIVQSRSEEVEKREYLLIEASQSFDFSVFQQTG